MNCYYSEKFENDLNGMIDERYKQDDYDPSCRIDHSVVDDAVRDLICELYAAASLNVDKIKQCLGVICQEYGIDFDKHASLSLQRTTQEKKKEYLQYMVGYTRAYAELFSRGGA